MYKRLIHSGCDYHSFDIGENRKLLAFFQPLKKWYWKRWQLAITTNHLTIACPWFRIAFFSVEKKY